MHIARIGNVVTINHHGIVEEKEDSDIKVTKGDFTSITSVDGGYLIKLSGNDRLSYGHNFDTIDSAHKFCEKVFNLFNSRRMLLDLRFEIAGSIVTVTIKYQDESIRRKTSSEHMLTLWSGGDGFCIKSNEVFALRPSALWLQGSRGITGSKINTIELCDTEHALKWVGAMSKGVEEINKGKRCPNFTGYSQRYM